MSILRSMSTGGRAARKGTIAEVKIEKNKKYAIVKNKENQTTYELKTEENLVDGIIIGIKIVTSIPSPSAPVNTKRAGSSLSPMPNG